MGTAANFTYDANGDMLTRVNNPGASGNLTTSANYTWDGLGRLTNVTLGNTSVVFAYDGLGRRVELTPKTWNGTAWVTGTVEYYLWDGDRIVQKRLGGNTSANISAAYYTYGYQTKSGPLTITGNYFYTKDHLGSVREVVNGNGTIVEGRYSYGPWGETIYLDYSGGAVAEPQFGYDGYFVSKYYPSLYFTKYRVYDPGLGRWLSRDPAGMAGGVNLYEYVDSSPVNFTDKNGLQSGGLGPYWFGTPMSDINTWGEWIEGAGEAGENTCSVSTPWEEQNQAIGNMIGQVGNFYIAVGISSLALTGAGTAVLTAPEWGPPAVSAATNPCNQYEAAQVAAKLYAAKEFWDGLTDGLDQNYEGENPSVPEDPYNMGYYLGNSLNP